MKENIEDKIVFSSEDEKNNYLSFITDEYNKNKVEVFKDSWKTIKKINTRSSKPDTLAKEFWNCYPIQAIGSGIIWLLPVGAVNLFTIIGGSFLLLSGLSTLNVKNNKFRGLIAASCSLIASPFGGAFIYIMWLIVNHFLCQRNQVVVMVNVVVIVNRRINHQNH